MIVLGGVGEFGGEFESLLRFVDLDVDLGRGGGR